MCGMKHKSQYGSRMTKLFHSNLLILFMTSSFFLLTKGLFSAAHYEIIFMHKLEAVKILGKSVAMTPKK